MDELLNPIHPKNPTAIAQEQPKTSAAVPPSNYIEGAEPVPLPSKGLFYNNIDRGRFANLESIMVRPLNYQDEDVLTTRAYFENGTIFNEILKNVIVDPNGFHYSHLVPVDRETILLWLRSTAFGKDFEIRYTCPACALETNVAWDLSELEIPSYDDDTLAMLKENAGEYIITTPITQRRIYITVPSIGQSMEAEKRLIAKKKSKGETKDFFGTGSLMLIVAGVEIEDNVGKRVIRNKTEIENLFNKINLPLADARYIRKQAEKINLSYNTKKTIVCKHCNHISEGVDMPIIHQNFFWPES
jgi:hypothetical protein